VGVSKVIGYVWLEKWNKQGMEGLKPNYGGGRPSELSEEQKAEGGRAEGGVEGNSKGER